MSEGLTMREILSGTVHTRERGKNMKQLPEYPHLYFSDLEHYGKAKNFAEKISGETLASFHAQFQTLERIATNFKETVEVFPDAPTIHGFYFREYIGNDFRGDGGVILHGADGPNWNVNLVQKKGIYWCTHT